MFGLLNLGSFMLGLVAWILPIVNLLKYKNNDNRNWIMLSILSFSACAIALGFQVFYINHKVNVEDWTALMDTMEAVAFASAVLLIFTFVLNAITLIVYRIRTAK
ncbi:hypothetical protein U5N28_16725 [Lysinibacillus telephonicus]|uniref:hypothetical protein n=1 Tax=Lysinibacillus telephonicus TaxID=1714840 RepID=UPI0031FC395F